MALTDREKINIVAPALRAIAAGGKPHGPPGKALKLVRFEKCDPPPDALVIELPAGAETPGQIVELLRQVLAPAGGEAAAVGVKDLGTFSITEPPATAGRAAGKVAVVTGAAQGFGLEIARDLAAEGACVVLGDIDGEGTVTAADQISKELGPGRALGLTMDVTCGGSVADAVAAVVDTYGGLDLLVSNAGVLMAGSVKSQPAGDFELVTSVNYKGYFLCVQKASPVMAVQHLARADYWSDIIQINSKSGLAGSNRNAAYAGSKFGGIGLTQSFALELMADGVKVNSICPGNFFDGPLWSDGETGLFVQYLRTGKVPGAKTIGDVRRAYEAKVPMGRGCTTADVMKAVYYLMEQQYETGQAVPVTGGQVMLK